jgi:hypothetical protein
MHFLVYDQKFREEIFPNRKKNSGGISANSGPEFRLLGTAENFKYIFKLTQFER